MKQNFDQPTADYNSFFGGSNQANTGASGLSNNDFPALADDQT